MLLLIVGLAAITLASITLQKTYRHLPIKELKRRARADDDLANVLYKAAAYGSSTSLLLWIITGASATAFFIIVNSQFSLLISVILSLALVWFGFAWLPKTANGRISITLAKIFTAPITWLVRQLYPLLSRLADWLSKSIGSGHTKLYQKDDLIELLNQQRHQHDNRISETELRIASGALTFGDKLVSQVMTPRRMVKAVAVSDDIGPHLMDELHASGHSRFPVYQEKADNFVGMLYVKDLLDVGHGGQVKNVMHKQLYYIHEQQSLNEVLQAFLKTKHHLFIVVNEFEEVVGIITIEDILEQILGKPIIDEFDKYDDMRAVAALKAKQEHQNQIPEETK